MEQNENNAEGDDEAMQTVNSLATLVSAMGTIDYDTGRFVKGERCLEATKRLEFLVKRDGDDQEFWAILERLGGLEVLQHVIIPCLQEFHDKPKQQYLCNLLMSIVQVLTIPLSINVWQRAKHLEYQRKYKKILCQQDVLHILLVKMIDPLKLEADERTENQNDQLHMLLQIFRNILAIPNALRADDEFHNLHDIAIENFNQQGIMDVFIEIAKTASAESDKIVLLLMECFGWYFFYEEPKTMSVNADLKRKSEMLGSIEVEKFKRVALKKKHLSKRHNRFGGTIVKKTLGGKQMFVHGTSTEPAKLSGEAYNMRIHATWKHKGKKLPRKYVNDKTRKCAMAVADAFLEQGFNSFIKICREYFEPKTDTQLQDEGDRFILYLKFLAFCMEYHRIRERMKYEKAKRLAKKQKTDPPDEKFYNGANIERVLNMDFINFLLKTVEQYLNTKKLKLLLQSPVELIENTLYATKEFVRAIYSMAKYGDQANNHNGRILIRNLTYEKAIIDLIHRTLKDFNPNKSDRTTLECLVECCYYLLSMIEELGKKGDLVMKHKRKKSKRRKKKDPPPEEFKESDAVEGVEVEISSEQKKDDAKMNGESDKAAPASGDPLAASGDPPAANPSSDPSSANAANQMDLDGEKEKSDKQAEVEKEKEANPENPPAKEGEDEALPMLDGYQVNGMNVDLNVQPDLPDEYIEKDKKEEFETILDIFATNKFVSDCFLLLEHFEENNDKLNSYIIWIMKKMAWDIKLYPMFFQVRIFDFFDRFFNHPLTVSTKKYDSIKKFGKGIIKKFFKLSHANPVLFSEALFFKRRNTIDEIKDPGHKRKMEDKKELERQERERRRAEKYSRKSAFDGDSDGDEAFVSSLNEAQWTEDENAILNSNYPIYADDASYLVQLQNILEMDAGSNRTEMEIERQLIRLGLRPKPRKRKKRKIKQRKEDSGEPEEPRWKRKVKLTSVRDTLISITSRAKRTKEEEDGVSWLIEKISNFNFGTIQGDKLGVDIALVPVQREEFDFLETRSLAQIFGALNFFGPSKSMGTAFWRVPGSYTKQEVREMAEIFKEGLASAGSNEMEEAVEGVSAVNNEEAPDIAKMMNEAFAGVSLDEGEEKLEAVAVAEPSSSSRQRNPKRSFEGDSDDDDELQIGRLQKKRKIIDDDED